MLSRKPDCSDFPRFSPDGTQIAFTGQSEKLTDFMEYDIKFPSLGKDNIVFENGGYIYKLDIHTRAYKKVPVIITNDQSFSRPEYKDASKSISTADISPNGERVVFGARGDVFSLPANKGITINYTGTSGATPFVCRYNHKKGYTG